jgi:hypothetical protein
MAGNLSIVHDEHSQAPAPRDRGYLSSQDMLARMTRILEIMESVMKDGTHYGQIPGTPKPTLYKAGAEKLLVTFQIAASVKDVIDLSTADEARYRVRVEGVSQATGVVLGEAWGECSSNEEKYRWRRPVCDEEFTDTPADQRREVYKRGPGGKAYKQKQVRTSPADVANTILQMATKRALVPMTRVVLACSDIFAQDLEDMPEELREFVVEGEPKPGMQAPQRKSEQTASGPKKDEPSTTLPAGAVLVTDTKATDGESNGRKWVLFTVWFSDGRKGGTFDTNVAAIADMAKHDKRPMWPVLTQVEGKKPGTFKLMGFEAAKDKPAPPAAPEKAAETPATSEKGTEPPSGALTAEDIPWSS